MPRQEVNARKEKLGKADALELAEAATHLYVAKGKKVVHLNMKRDEPDADTLTKLLLGPTGNLRAPVLRKGRTVVVGFNEETYRTLFT